MGTTATASLSIAYTGDPVGNPDVGPLTMVAPAALDQRQIVNLASGWNGISPIPAGATMFWWQMPAGNAQTVTLKGASGDTGIPVALTGFGCTGLGASPTIGFTAGGAVNGVEIGFC